MSVLYSCLYRNIHRRRLVFVSGDMVRRSNGCWGGCVVIDDVRHLWFSRTARLNALVFRDIGDDYDNDDDDYDNNGMEEDC